MHYIIVIVIILCIIAFQVFSYADTKKKIREYRKIFPKSISSYSIKEILIKDERATLDDDLPVEEDEEELMSGIPVSQIEVRNASSTMSEVRNALNKYLQKNKGSASDFHLMKDVVERYCDAEAEEISTQQPIPLYLGLMGTMVGIIVGIAYVAISGGLAGAKIAENIAELMSCVAIAMSASFIGVYCTTRISWSSKDAFSEVEADKNCFYSWLQTELLPTLSGDTVNALYLLQQNLSTFNNTFQTNIAGLNRALEQVKETSTEQVELINLISDIDIKRVAQANVTVLHELKGCTSELSTFNRYLHNVSEYLTAVNSLNSNINEHLNRTAAIERMGAFFEREIEQVKSREQYINEVVANVDNTLRQTFDSLSESTAQGVQKLRNDSVSQFDSVSQTMAAQQQEFRESLRAQRDEFAQALRTEEEAFLTYLRGQKEDLSSKSNEITELVKEIRSLADTKSSMNELVSVSRQQSAKIDELIEALRNKKDKQITPLFKVPAYLKISVLAICVASIISMGIGLVSLIQNNTRAQEQASVNEKVESLSNTIESVQNTLNTVISEGENSEDTNKEAETKE